MVAMSRLARQIGLELLHQVLFSQVRIVILRERNAVHAVQHVPDTCLRIERRDLAKAILAPRQNNGEVETGQRAIDARIARYDGDFAASLAEAPDLTLEFGQVIARVGDDKRNVAARCVERRLVPEPILVRRNAFHTDFGHEAAERVQRGVRVAQRVVENASRRTGRPRERLDRRGVDRGVAVIDGLALQRGDAVHDVGGGRCPCKGGVGIDGARASPLPLEVGHEVHAEIAPTRRSDLSAQANDGRIGLVCRCGEFGDAHARGAVGVLKDVIGKLNFGWSEIAL